MSLLVSALKSNNSVASNGNIDSVKTFNVPTGFSLIDVLGGDIDTNARGVTILNGGICNRNYMAVGESAVGKTTLELQEITSCADWWNSRYKHNGEGLSDVINLNLENNTPINRFKGITLWSDVDCLKHLISVNGSTSTKAIYDMLVSIANEKEKNKDKYIVETDMIDIDGNPLKTYVHTYCLLDSIPAMKNVNSIEDYEKTRDGEIKTTDAIMGNMDAMREAKENTEFILKVKPLCEKYGIVLKAINHIVDEPKLSMFEIPKRYLPSLKPGKKLKGGKEWIYQAYGITDIQVKERLNEKNPLYGDDIIGIISQVSYIKNKANSEGVYYRMVFDGPTGYRPELSDFEYLFNADMYGINGSGRYSLKILPEISFTRKKLLEECQNNPLLARALQFTAKTKMIHDIILRKPAPDLTPFAELPYEERVALIINYTTYYPQYERNDHVLKHEDMMAKFEGDKYIADKDYGDMSKSFLTNFLASMLLKDEEGMSFIPTFGKGVTPYNMDSHFNFEEFVSTN